MRRRQCDRRARALTHSPLRTNVCHAWNVSCARRTLPHLPGTLLAPTCLGLARVLWDLGGAARDRNPFLRTWSHTQAHLLGSPHNSIAYPTPCTIPKLPQAREQMPAVLPRLSARTATCQYDTAVKTSLQMAAPNQRTCTPVSYHGQPRACGRTRRRRGQRRSSVGSSGELGASRLPCRACQTVPLSGGTQQSLGLRLDSPKACLVLLIQPCPPLR